jgi:hypothetical protein
MCFSVFRKSAKENLIITIEQEQWVICMKINIHLLSHLVQFFLERKMLETQFVEKIKTRVFVQWFIYLFQILCCSCDNVENYVRGGRAIGK